MSQGFDALIDPPPDQWQSCRPSNKATGFEMLEVLAGLRDSTDCLDRYFGYLDFAVARTLNRDQRGKAFARVFPAFHDWLSHPDGGATQDLVGRGNQPIDAQLFGMFLENAMLFTERHFAPAERALFLHSWNYWHDGSQLEPSLLDGDLLWNATRDAIDRARYLIQTRAGAAPWEDNPRTRQIAMMCEAARLVLQKN